MYKRLRSTGEVADTKIKPDDTPDKIVRSVILVHSGPDGSENTLASSDGDISFNQSRIRSVVQNHNAMITELAVSYGGFSKMPIGAFPPILNQHQDDSADRILGRLTGLLRFEVRDVPKVGNNVATAVCDVTFLGKDTVDKIKDGRYYHVSVGIDESSDTLGETSIVIEPAAPGAMILKKRKLKKNKGVPKMSITELKAAVADMKKLSKDAQALKKKVNLAKRKVEVKGQFVKLMADKKMSPSEFRKLDLTKLAKLDKDSLETVMGVYDSREHLVKSGQMGTTSAVTFTEMGTKEDREVKRLKAEAKKNMAKLGAKFKLSADDDDKKDLEKDDEAMDKKELSMDDMVDDPAQDQDGDTDAANQNEEMMQQIEENAAQIARVASMVESIIEDMGEKPEDEKDDAADEGEESEMSDDDKKEEDDKEEDDKEEDEAKKKEMASDDDKDKKDLEKEKDDKKEESK